MLLYCNSLALCALIHKCVHLKHPKLIHGFKCFTQAVVTLLMLAKGHISYISCISKIVCGLFSKLHWPASNTYILWISVQFCWDLRFEILFKGMLRNYEQICDSNHPHLLISELSVVKVCNQQLVHSE